MSGGEHGLGWLDIVIMAALFAAGIVFIKIGIDYLSRSDKRQNQTNKESQCTLHEWQYDESIKRHRCKKCGRPAGVDSPPGSFYDGFNGP